MRPTVCEHEALENLDHREDLQRVGAHHAEDEGEIDEDGHAAVSVQILSDDLPGVVSVTHVAAHGEGRQQQGEERHGAAQAEREPALPTVHARLNRDNLQTVQYAHPTAYRLRFQHHKT